MKRLLRALEVLAWAAFFAFAALVLALRYWVLPDIERYRGDIVAAMSRAIGLPVKIGAHRAPAGWACGRGSTLSDVRIYDAQGREALVLPAVENVVAWRSLLHGELRLHSLVIDGPQLAVRRDAAGDFYVAGLKIGKSGRRAAAALRLAPRPGARSWCATPRSNGATSCAARRRWCSRRSTCASRATATSTRARPHGAPAARARQQRRAARAGSTGAALQPAALERPRLPAARLHRPRRLARLGRLPDRRAPGRGRAARLGDAWRTAR